MGIFLDFERSNQPIQQNFKVQKRQPVQFPHMIMPNLKPSCCSWQVQTLAPNSSPKRRNFDSNSCLIRGGHILSHNPTFTLWENPNRKSPETHSRQLLSVFFVSDTILYHFWTIFCILFSVLIITEHYTKLKIWI